MRIGFQMLKEDCQMNLAPINLGSTYIQPPHADPNLDEHVIV